MKKIIVMLLVLGFAFTSVAQQYGVQVAAFDQQVGSEYFNSLNYRVKYEPYKNDIHVYFIEGFETVAAAEVVKNEAVSNGFVNARVIDFVDIAQKCELNCGIAVTYTPGDLRLESIFFDFDRYTLRSKSKAELNKLYRVLNQHPNATAQLKAHTDAKGSNEYNDQLSLNRASAAKNYLINRGISANRLVTSRFGEETPIAKNEIEGRDTPAGRQYNRRVELIVLDGDGAVMNVVDPIIVPEGLQ